MLKRSASADILPGLIRERILVLDGAMGTMIQRLNLDEAAVRGPRFADHKKDLVNVDGEKVYSPEVEAVLMQHPHVA